MNEGPNKERITFALAPGMPLGARFWWICGLILAGIALQMFFSVLLGWLMVAGGAALAITQGQTTKLDVSPLGKWENATFEELQAIKNLSGKIGDWRARTDSFTITSTSGFVNALLVLAALALACIVCWFLVDRPGIQSGDAVYSLIPPAKGGLVTTILALNALTMLVPVWLFGRITAWEPPELPRKVGYLMAIRDRFESASDLEFLPSLYLHTESEKTVPTDCRMLVKIKDAPKDFIGIQVQISLNDVQGTKYPYCYAVVIARQTFQIAEKALPQLSQPVSHSWLGRLKMSSNDAKEAAFQRFNRSIVEISSESDVDVLVVRQVTRGTGYSTSEGQAVDVFTDALGLSRHIVGV